MSQNHHIPSPDCAFYAPLLPLAEHHLLSEPEEARLRTHLASCAHCRSELHIYAAVEEALRRSFAPRQGVSPPFSREELMHTIDQDTDHPIDHPTPSAPPSLPVTSSRRARRFLAGLPALAAVLAIVLIAVLLFVVHGGLAPGLNSATATPAPERGSDAELHDISMVSAADGWAVGYVTPADDANGLTAVLMHYTHGRWSRVATSIGGRVNSVSMVSASEGWAVGDTGLLLHYDGKTWKKVTSQAQGNLVRVYMLSATDGWAVGDGYNDSTTTGILHYDGRQWTPQLLPASLNIALGQNNITLSDLSMLSASEGWAVGTLILPSPDSARPVPPSGVVLHYTQGQWQVQQIFPGAELQSISMLSPADGWAVGYTDTIIQDTRSDPPGPVIVTDSLLLHYTSNTWTQALNPLTLPGAINQHSLAAVVFVSPTDGWMASVGTIVQEMLHYDGKQWIAVSLPAASAVRNDSKFYTISRIAMISASEGWAVGYAFSTRAGGIPIDSVAYQPTVTPVILHYHNGSWSLFPS